MSNDLAARRASDLLSDERFRLLVESVRDYAIFMLDPSGRVASWSAGAELIKGYSAAEVIGQPISLFYTPEDLAAHRPQLLLDAAARDGRVEDEGWRVRKDGTRFWADVVITAVRDSRGELTAYGKVTRDLTERRMREERVRQDEERFRLMVDGIRDYAVFMLDPSGRVATWNSGAERIKGYRAAEIIGSHFSRFYRPEQVRAGVCERELEVAAREGRFEDEGLRVRRDGTEFWANVVLSALRDRDDRLIGFIKVTRDLTDRKRAEEERLGLAKAHEAIRLRDEFLSIASHELKTPLTAMQLQIESLQERAVGLDARIARRLERAARSGQRLARLIDSLLDVSRITSGTLPLEPEVMELGDTVQGVLDSMQETAVRAGSTLSLTGSGTITGHWDRLRIEQVVGNLLANALTYGAGEPVSVALTQQGQTAVIEVCDRGPGIPQDDLVRIFGRFERAASARNYGGLGLGLYVCAEIVAGHGGTIVAENRTDGGARFVVRLPMRPPDPSEDV